MAVTTLSDFVSSHAEQDLRQGLFELENEKILEVNLGCDGVTGIWMKVGAMIAYTGAIRFTREGLLDQGIGNLLKKAVSGEGASLSKAEGDGKLYLADGDKRITVLRLRGETVFINGRDLLAMEPTLSREITMMRKLSAIASGGLFNVRVGGTGLVAFCTHGRALVLPVTPAQPVFTDPQATVCWSGNLKPELNSDMSLRTFLGRGSGETFQMRFVANSGNGFVVVQPFEERPMQNTGG